MEIIKHIAMLIVALIATLAVLATGPALAFLAYQIEPALALAAFGVGVVVGPFVFASLI